MTTKEIEKSYNVLKGVKLSKLKSADQFLVIKALRVLKPVAEQYAEDMKQIEDRVTSCTKEELEENRKLIQAHNNAEQTKSTDGILTTKQIVELNTFFKKVSEEITGIQEKLESEEHELNHERIEEEAFKELLECNDLSAEDSMVLMDLLCK